MFRGLLFAAMLGFCLPAKAQTVEELLQQGDQLEKQMKEVDALNKYKEVLKIQSNNLTALTWASLLDSREGDRQEKKEAKSRFFEEAKAYAAQALAVGPNDPDANYAMAVAMGRIALIAGAKDKVAASKDVKQYAELAIKFRPNFGEAWYVLGKWNYEVATLNAFEKGAAKMLFGGLPDGTLANAIADFEKCRQLNPGFILNYYDLAIAYKKNDQIDKAEEILRKVPALRPIHQDDPKFKANCKKLLEDMQ
ncbi:Tetratricopeptide repeat-containing protein [Chitinophaga costaii]|uniref:Regulator of microtubule dynamics protein 1 n=1 Tax=Chitinophaga costaii TaxID=1335309 RepID=A0A1C4E693_9BACT|nr:tetratricopeptide repeat protein [Chitinophaga costaii]PUZ24296.1 tetratricopeptide repeat protein [Chitinophaga costaii]SCC39118.1 Tetratricopeptide repeat-containing protein [Chitinophaga costaii]